MHVLIVKTSSLGDVIHTLPAVTDANRALPGIRCDWVVEEAFQAVPGWHPAVDRVIPVALRRWRRDWRSALGGEWRTFQRQLRACRYDAVIDAQGLLKSAWLTRLARGPRHGPDRASAREPLAALTYRYRHRVATDRHAVDRIRRLFAASLGYTPPDSPPDSGIDRTRLPAAPQDRYLVFLHGTTWPSKHWPESYWLALARLAGQQGLRVRLPWYGDAERARAERIAAAGDHVLLLERLDLAGIAGVLAGAAGVVGVDTGLAHLAAALGVPGVTLYGPTSPALTGALGPRQSNLDVEFVCAPCRQRHCTYDGPAIVEPACFGQLPPQRVMDTLLAQMSSSDTAAL